MSALEAIQQRISNAAIAANRDPSDITLIAVSKVQPLPRIETVLQQGQRVFGENRVQEAQTRWPALLERYEGVELHLIGPLQTNKLKAAVDLFDVIQTLDRDRLARKLAETAQQRGRCPSLYVQINTGEEAQKAGISPEKADAFIAACRGEYDLPIEGVMAIPPADEDPQPHFEMLADIGQRNGLEGLSMGMSSDFEQAIAHGATCVRVGSALFGARDPSAVSG